MGPVSIEAKKVLPDPPCLPFSRLVSTRNNAKKKQFVVDRLDYQRASRDVYNRKAVGLLALQASSSAPAAPAEGGVSRRNRSSGDGVGGKGEGERILWGWCAYVCFFFLHWFVFVGVSALNSTYYSKQRFFGGGRLMSFRITEQLVSYV